MPPPPAVEKESLRRRGGGLGTIGRRPGIVKFEPNETRELVVDSTFHELLHIEARSNRAEVCSSALVDCLNRHSAPVYRKAHRQTDVVLLRFDANRQAG